MARKQIINGKVYDWSSVSIDLTGCTGMEPTEITYGDEVNKEIIYGKGGNFRGYGTGEKKNSVKLTMLREDYLIMMDSLGKDFYNLVIPNVTVSYADTGATTSTDIIKNLTFSKRDLAAKSGDTSISVSLEGIAIGGIEVGV